MTGQVVGPPCGLLCVDLVLGKGKPPGELEEWPRGTGSVRSGRWACTPTVSFSGGRSYFSRMFIISQNHCFIFQALFILSFIFKFFILIIFYYSSFFLFHFLHSILVSFSFVFPGFS